MNEVRIVDDTVNVWFRGDQTKELVLKTASESARMLDELAAGGKPMKSLIDMSAIGKVGSDARAAGAEAMKDVRDAKAAIVGAPNFIKHILRFIVRASGKQTRLLFVDSREEALEWLASDSPD